MSTSWWHSLVWPTLSVKVGHARLLMASSTPRPGKGPVFPMIAPSVFNEEVRLVAAGQKKRWSWYESYLSFTPAWGEGLSSQRQWSSSSNWLAPRSSPRSESDPRGRARSAQPHIAARSFGWRTRKLKSRKLILKAVFGFSLKFSTPENYPPYGIW